MEQNAQTDNLEKRYQKLLEEYLDLWREVRKAEQEGDAGFTRMLDEERHAKHVELLEVGMRMGRGYDEVMFDILAREGNLKEYGLPECKIMRAGEVFPQITQLIIGDNGEEEMYFGAFQREWMQAVGQRVFIPFGVRKGWHLFDYQEFIQRDPGDKERVRRAYKVIQNSEGKAKFTSVISSRSFHNEVEIFGITCLPSEMERIFTYMRMHKHEVVPSEKFFAEEQLLKDWKEIIKEDIEKIYAYRGNTWETPEYVLNRLLDVYKGRLRHQFLSITKEIFAKEIERAHEAEIEARVEDEMRERDRLLEQVGGEEWDNKPSRETMSRTVQQRRGK